MLTVWWMGRAALAGIDVNGVDYTDLQLAIDAAVSGDTLVFDGGYYAGPGAYVDGKTLTFEGNGSTIELTVSAPALIQLGGSAGLTATDLTFVSSVGRGLDLGTGSSITLSDVTFQTLVANGNGGGIQANDPDSITLTRVVFDGTSVGGTSSSQGEGAGLWVDGAVYPVVLTDVSFVGTAASREGGGLWVQDSDLTCDRCSFDTTTASADGGAVYATGTAGTLTIHDSTFTTTTAGSGGAIRTSRPLTLTGSVLCGTSAGNDGGAIYSTAGGGTLTNNVFLDGSGSDGGALSADTGTWLLQWNHFVSASADQAVYLEDATTTANHNLFLANSGVGMERLRGTLTDDHNAYFGNSSTVTGGEDPTDVLLDPRLTSFLDDDDCTNDQLWPRFDSPLLDAGDAAYQDPDGTTADIGAFGGPDADPALHLDADGDGFSLLRECDDTEDTVFPGAPEVCDTLDNDCDTQVDDDPAYFTEWVEDCDGDGQGATDSIRNTCFVPVTSCDWLAFVTPEDGGDCNDADPDAFLGADEYCRAGDQDCDGNGSLDELGAVDGTAFYLDEDGDGYGDPLAPVVACGDQAGIAAVAGDCDDLDASVKPGVPDVCGDGLDTDCSGGDGTAAEAIEQYPDADGDTFGDQDPLPVFDCVLLPGHVTNNDDCNDALATTNPLAAEVCDEDDNDCNGIADDTDNPVVDYFRDVDQDGFGDTAVLQPSSCGKPAGFVDVSGDCDDDEPQVNPDATETCNDKDDDCDTLVDLDDDSVVGAVTGWKDVDGDGFGTCGDDPDCAGTLLCAYGDVGGTSFVANHDDCNDAAVDVNPDEIEVPDNTVDENCDESLGPVADEPPVEDPGCNCDTSGAPTLPAAAALLTLLLLRRRRA